MNNSPFKDVGDFYKPNQQETDYIRDQRRLQELQRQLELKKQKEETDDFLRKCEKIVVEPHKVPDIVKQVMKTIDYEKRMKNPIESVTLSGWKYDIFEKFLEKHEIINENNYQSVLSWKNVDIERSNDSSFAGLRVNYRKNLTTEQAKTFLERNMEQFKIEGVTGNKIADNVLKYHKK